MMRYKQGQQWDVLVKILIVIIVIAVVSFLIIGAGRIGAEQTNQTTQGTKDKLENCLKGDVFCEDAILGSTNTNTNGGVTK